MKKEKNIYFRDYVPVLIGLVLLVVLGYAFYLVYNYVNPKENTKLNTNTTIAARQKEKKVEVASSACPNVNLTQYRELAQELTVEYEFKPKVIGTEYVDSIDYESGGEVLAYAYSYLPTLYVSNLKEGLLIKMTNDNPVDGDGEYVLDDNYLDEYGRIAFDAVYNSKVTTYTFKVYVNVDGCKDVMVRKFTYQVPIYNGFSSTINCLEYPEFEYCAEFLYEDALTDNKFYRAFYKYVADVESGKITTKPHTTKNLLEYLTPQTTVKGGVTTTKKVVKEETKNKNNKYYIIGGATLAVILIIIGGSVIVKKKRGKH